jgi:hypothetical protein
MQGEVSVKATLNLIIDVVAFIGFLFLTATGVLMRYILPPGSGRFSSIWGLNRHEWGTIHFWISAAFLAVLAVHLLLHWRWIVCTITGRPSEKSGLRAGLGLVGLLALVALAFAPVITPVEVSEDALTRGKDIQIRGSMTLAELEQKTGVPAEHILKALNLPDSISKDQRLGILKRTYGFEMGDVRRVIREYKGEPDDPAEH